MTRAADGGLHRHLEKLAGNVILELFAQAARTGIRLILMCDEAQRVHLVAVEQHIDLHELAAAVAGKLVVKRGVALGVGLERVEEIVDDLVERHFVVQLDEVGIKVLHILELAAAFLTHRHNVADVVGRRDDGRP